jgi:hypothetical protein
MTALVHVDDPGAGGFGNTAFGFEALSTNTTGIENTALGFHALFSNTVDGDLNTAVGYSALSGNTTGAQNTATGVTALSHNTTGTFNTATGTNALHHNTTGSSNTAVGVSALSGNIGGNNNTASGISALFNNTTGNENTAAGANALFDNSTGIRNTAVGRSALRHSTGTKNIAIGFQAGATLVNGNNNIYLGNSGNGDESQTIRIGTAQTQTFIAGINFAAVSGATVTVDDNGQLGVPFSSARYKQDIAPMGPQSEKLLQLQPVTFAYKDDSKGTTHYGLIAEQVATVYPELVTRTATGEVQTVKYQELIPMLLNELQRQRQDFQQTLQTQQQTLQTQAQALQNQQRELAELRALVRQRREIATSLR